MNRASPAFRWWFRLFAASLSGLWALGLGGCASPVYEVRVSALARGESAKPASFRLVPYASALADKSPAANAAHEIVQRALTHKGFRPAPQGTTPDLFVVVGCGLSNGSIRLETTGTPIYALVSGGWHEEERQVGVDRNGSPIYQTVRVPDPPTQQVVGYDYQTAEVTALKKYLRVFAFDQDPLADKTDQAMKQTLVWAVQAVFESDDKNLDKMLPVLAAAGMVFIGQATSSPVPIRMRGSDPDIASLH